MASYSSQRTCRKCVRAEMVRVSVPLKVEAPRKHCFDLFSDLSKMSEWSSTLQAVSRDPEDPIYSDWDFSWNGIRLSWRARDGDLLETEQNDSAIRWRSVSGLNHTGAVEFTDISEKTTRMVMTVDYDVASLLAVVMQSSMVSNFVEGAIESDLQRFRTYALRTYRRKKIGSRSSAEGRP